MKFRKASGKNDMNGMGYLEATRYDGRVPATGIVGQVTNLRSYAIHNPLLYLLLL